VDSYSGRGGGEGMVLWKGYMMGIVGDGGYGGGEVIGGN
jgi:hypothetical protein